MQPGTVFFNGLDLATLGKVSYRLARQPDPPAPFAPTRMRVTIAVSIHLAAMEAGTLQARLEHLQRSMHADEGILRMESPGGHYLQYLARPAGDSLPQALEGRSTRVELEFGAWEAAGDDPLGGLISATLTPLGGAAITLHALQGWDQDTQTERAAALSTARTLTTTTYAFTGRYYQANPADPEATRWQALRTAAAQLDALNTRYATLATGGSNLTVRISRLTPKIDDARGVVDARIECFHVDLPGDNSAIVEMQPTFSKDAGTGEDVQSWSGTITAEDEATAILKLDAITAAKAGVAGARLTSLRFTPHRITGGDAATEEWIGTMPFSFEIRIPQDAVTSFTATSAENEDEKGRTIRISGEVRGRDTAAMLAKAQAIAASFSGGSLQTRSEIQTEWTTPVSSDTAVAIVMKFSFDHLATSQRVIGTVTHNRTRPAFAEHLDTISGSITADSYTNARAIARAWIPPSVLLRQEDEQESFAASGDLQTQTPRPASEIVALYPNTLLRTTAEGPPEDELQGYTLSGVTYFGTSEPNAFYEPVADVYDKPAYQNSATTTPYRIQWQPGVTDYWQLWQGLDLLARIASSADTPPLTGWENVSPNLAGSVALAIDFSGTAATEIGQLCLVGDAAPYLWFSADSLTPTRWRSLDPPPQIAFTVIPGQQFTTMNFTYAWLVTRGDVTIQYEDTTNSDETAMQAERTITGTVRAADAATAAAELAAFLESIETTAPVKKNISQPYECHGTWQNPPNDPAKNWIALNFTFTWILPLTGTLGHDIVEASLSLQRNGSINRPAVHFVPYGSPVVQTNTGNTPGTFTVSARCSARSLATAKAWVQGKRASAPAGGHENENPNESQDTNYLPLSGTSVRYYTFTGRYSWIYASGLSGTW